MNLKELWNFRCGIVGRNFGISELWNCGISDFRNYGNVGKVELWNYGIVEFWNCGIVGKEGKKEG